ncbi:MAG: rhodanese-like domain-containing protein [Rubrivivax sp.]|nr:rhodanese-like domain-containing protein [Rubrivivax sp.]
MKTAQQLVDEALAQVRTLSVEEARALHGQEGPLFVDLRDVRELEREGAVPGAFHAPRGMLEFWVDPESIYFKPVFVPGRQLVLFCAAGWRSALATKSLQDMGLSNVCHIDGGFTAWREAGAPVVPPVKKA